MTRYRRWKAHGLSGARHVKSMVSEEKLPSRIVLAVAFMIHVCSTFAITTRAEQEMQWAIAVFPTGEEFALEVAADDATRARGYMFREKVGAGEGMLFVFDEPGPHGFWMKNCKVALDIIWLDRDFRVVDISRETEPCPERGDCPTVYPMRAAHYVLEVAAGTSRRSGLERGDRINVLAEPALR